MSNPRLQSAILEVVDNQLRDLHPPQTKETYDRLISRGYSDQKARQLIGAVVATEMFEMTKNNELFDEERFVEALNKLPDSPV